MARLPKIFDKVYREAEQQIAEARRTGATTLSLSSMDLTELPDSLWEFTALQTLDLSRNQLTVLSESIGQLTQLTKLDLSSNQLTALPEAIDQLTQLRSLNLYKNQLTVLPESIVQLTQLTYLNLSNNQLTVLPENIGQLFNLRELVIYWNRLSTVPESIGQLHNLERFLAFGMRVETFYLPKAFVQLLNLIEINVGGTPLGSLPESVSKLHKLKTLEFFRTELDVIPDWIGSLTNLERLNLSQNRLVSLPSSLAQLAHLEKLNLDRNPLNSALQSAYEQGLPAVMAYLRSLEQNAEPLYEAKLVLVGEGDVGKTTLLKALKGNPDDAPKAKETTTHGVEIDIHGLKLPHPDKEDVEIQLNAWDFGGQDVYRVTHQFFFSKRSLYILVWEPRGGVQKGQVEDWLNMIRLRVGDDARVLIVSTHCKTGERIARIDQPVFLRDYPGMIAGFYEVDSLVPDPEGSTGEMTGIAALKQVIAAEAAKLEQMGTPFNNDWKAARDELLALPEPRISYAQLMEVCAAHGLDTVDTATLAGLMHDLGYIVHYKDDENLRNDVVLKPQWLTKAIGFVLENQATQDADGILPDKRLYEVWHDHEFKDEPRYDREIYPFFLRLMEKYDVSYRLPDGSGSLVAQHVPQVRPDLPWLPEKEPPADLRRIAMVCAMEEDPPGLVPWMIVRTHDYATEYHHEDGKDHRLHWQKGMFLCNHPHGDAMLEKRGREFHIYTQGDYPEYFMNVLQETLRKLITDNWPGLAGRYRFTVPCPGQKDGKPCPGRFNLNALRQFMAKGAGMFPCQECMGMYSITELLLGFEERSVDQQLREIREQLAGLDSRIANYFMATMRAIADEAKAGPRLFTFRSAERARSPKRLVANQFEMLLWCEAEGCQHPVVEVTPGKGLYKIDVAQEWVRTVAPYANFALKVLSTVIPVAGPAINTFFGPDTMKNWGIKDQLDLAKSLLSQLPDEIKPAEHGLTPRGILNDNECAGLLAFHDFLRQLDPHQEHLGLHRVATYTGDYRWLCQQHYEAWQPNIPDQI